MKSVMIVIVMLILSASMAFCQGTVGSVSGPAEAPEVQPEITPETNPAPAAAPATYVPMSADDLPQGESYADTQKAARMTLSGQHGDINACDVSAKKVTADYGSFKVLYVNGRRIVLDKDGNVFGSKNTAAKARAKKRVPFQHTWNKAARKANVVSGSYVDARDNQNLAMANAYTNQKVGQVWIGVIIAIILAIIGIILGLRYIPHYRRVHY